MIVRDGDERGLGGWGEALLSHFEGMRKHAWDKNALHVRECHTYQASQSTGRIQNRFLILEQHVEGGASLILCSILC